MGRINFILLVTLFCQLSFAQKLQEAEGTVSKILWYQPIFIEGGKPQFLRTMFSGKTLPRAKVQLGASEVKVVYKSRISNFETAQLLTGPEVINADANGYFELFLDLPAGSVQLPLKVTFTENSTKLYQMNVEVSSERVELSTMGKLAVSPALTNPAYLWAGIGLNYVNLTQDSNDGDVHINFASFRMPAFFIEGLIPITGNWGVIPSYKVSPGSVSSPSNIKVKTGTYNWTIMMLEGRYSQRTWKSQLWDRPAKYLLRFGLNQHTVPFWVRGTGATADIVTNTVMMASLGAQADYELSNKWSIASMFRYQFPLSSGSLFNVKTKLSFDASIGAYHRFQNQWNIGGFIYGQYHTWSFTHLDPVIDKDISGDQAIVFSNIEVRAGYVF